MEFILSHRYLFNSIFILCTTSNVPTSFFELHKQIFFSSIIKKIDEIKTISQYKIDL